MLLNVELLTELQKTVWNDFEGRVNLSYVKSDIDLENWMRRSGVW